MSRPGEGAATCCCSRVISSGIRACSARSCRAHVSSSSSCWSRSTGGARASSWIRLRNLAPQAATLEPYSWPIPSLTSHGFASLSVGGAGWFLVGDAAGLVDPITREGIYFALQSGEWVTEALSSGEPLGRYHERIRDEIVADLMRAADFKAKFFADRFRGLLLDALRRSGKVRQIMGDLIAGEQPYATLKRSLLQTVELGLAWQLVRSKWYNRPLKE